GADNAVQVAWETARESHHAGFHLYRATSADGTFVRLTGEMITGGGFSAGPKTYRFVDRSARPGALYYYLLEDVDAAGLRTDHGPVCVDWDGDGLPDDWEIAQGLNPALDDAGQDPDHDGLSNLLEYERGTDPLNPDSDGDGIGDGIDDGRIARDDSEQLQSVDRGVYVVAADDAGITVELRTEFFDSTVIRAGDREFERLHIAEYVHGATDAVGWPEMPLKGILVDLPADRAAGLTIVATEVATHAGYRVYPVPQNVADASGERVAEVFVIDEQAYGQDGFYPNTTAELGQTYRFRDQSKQQVIFYPLAFNPATGQMMLYTRIRVRISYGDGSLAAAGQDRLRPAPWKLPAAGPSITDSAFGLLAAVADTSPVLSRLMFSPILSIGLFNAALWSVPESAPPAVTAYKILTFEKGLYQLSCADLDAAGVPLAGSDMSSLRLYHLGDEVAVEVADANGALCDNSDTIRFYAPAVADAYAKYAADNVFWLTTDAAAGTPLRMDAIASSPGAAPPAVSHDVVVHAEDDEDYWKEVVGADALDRWYSLSYVSATEAVPVGSPVLFPLSVPGPTGSGSLKVLMASTRDKEHEVDVEVVGAGGSLVVETFTWSGLELFEAVIDEVAFDAADAAHSVSITCNSGADFILVDWIEAAYPRDFTAAGGLLEFTHQPGYN
ncbi:MAG: hypothetical protein KJO87_00915, partial [Acidimicrobiia bacterium]|nr:hypothetical protein [Acidimicrobiia bacterium]